MVKVPADRGIPLTLPVVAFSVRPGGRLVAVNLVGELAATIWWEKAAPTDVLAEALLVNAGGAPRTRSVNLWVPVPAALVAARVTMALPLVVGVPEIIPEVAFKERPEGNPLAPKLVGLWVARILKEKAVPTFAVDVLELVMTGGPWAMEIVRFWVAEPPALFALI